MLSYLENLPQEAPTAIQHSRPPKGWPHAGTIEFENYSMRYHPGLDLVLKDLSFSARSNEKIGIVGRTGAGKSSMSQALMRLVEPASGKIVIDGVDISSIGLFDLRSRISIIPQDPALFVGTIRDNLDPLHQYSDEAIWKAIQLAQIVDLLEIPTGKYIKPDMTKDLPDDYDDVGPWIEGVGLQKWVDYGGKNFSVGQRQLISLCRALLWRRKILLLDEATANVDSKTDQIMQSVIRKEFKDCTILTIAHRLGTIMDSDRILVVDDGRIVEFDTPANLLKRNGHFTLLVESMNQAQNK
ncbi:ATP-binding cassette glutathione S-conjugate transporter ycf1 [Coemansia sp. RSA 487]|nr:ATP-binding cassette glutathione S-conjugate transporter ycf1 [Coemansia sp. RSA 487]